MKPAMPLLTTSRVFLAAAVLSTLVAGCGRHNADSTTASNGATGSSSTMSASSGMGKDASTTAASNTGSTGNSMADSTAAATPAPTGTTPATTASTDMSSAGSASGASAAGTSAAGTGAAATPDDAQIAGIVTAANNGEIAAGKMAESKAQNAKVKDFAREMVKAHTAMNQEGMALEKKKHMTTADSDVSKTLKDDSAKEAANLKSMTGAGFDKAYIDSQVTDHEKVLMMIDNVLLPNAKDADLKAMLQKARPAVNMHLDQAKALQTSMK